MQNKLCMHKLVSMRNQGLKVYNTDLTTHHNFSDCDDGGCAAMDFLAYRGFHCHTNEYTWRPRDSKNYPSMLLLRHLEY